MTEHAVERDRCGILTLKEYVAEERRPEFCAYVQEMLDEGRGDIDHDFLGFIADYILYAELLERKLSTHKAMSEGPFGRGPLPPLTVYDVGCASALQHVVFPPDIHYVGVDVFPQRPAPKFFRPNCRFVSGRWSEVADQLDIHPKYSIGIANMSLLYSMSEESEMAVFDRKFRSKFVL